MIRSHLLCNIILSRLYILRQQWWRWFFWGAGELSPTLPETGIITTYFEYETAKRGRKTPERQFHRDVCKLAACQSLRRGVMEAEGSRLTGAQMRRLLLCLGGRSIVGFSRLPPFALFCVSEVLSRAVSFQSWSYKCRLKSSHLHVKNQTKGKIREWLQNLTYHWRR